MTIVLELSVDQERRLAEATQRRDAAVVKAILYQAIDSKVAGLLDRPSASHAKPLEAKTPKADPAGVSSAGHRGLADLLTETFASTAPEGSAPLPDEALSRRAIYGDHP